LVIPEPIDAASLGHIPPLWQEQGLGFHSHDGWFFKRLHVGGDVLVTYAPVDPLAEDAGVNGKHWPLLCVVLDADTWASIVASVSCDGETGPRYQEALRFHQHHNSGLPEVLIHGETEDVVT
jgi:hypothetical protein